MKDQCVLVTGATRGIGWAISQKLADMGCHVVGLARHAEDIDFPGYLYACDLHDAGQTEDILRVIREKYPIDAIVNNVGLASSAPIEAIELAQLYDTLDINVRVAVQVMRAFASGMKARQAGRIVNITGQAANGWPKQTCYAAAKSALVACTKTWALELAASGITVNAVSPGFIDTELFREAHPPGSDAEKLAIDRTPVKRLGMPSEIAATVAFLLSREAGFITGQVIGVDGGNSLAGACPQDIHL